MRFFSCEQFFFTLTLVLSPFLCTLAFSRADRVPRATFASIIIVVHRKRAAINDAAITGGGNNRDSDGLILVLFGSFVRERNGGSAFSERDIKIVCLVEALGKFS